MGKHSLANADAQWVNLLGQMRLAAAADNSLPIAVHYLLGDQPQGRRTRHATPTLLSQWLAAAWTWIVVSLHSLLDRRGDACWACLSGPWECPRHVALVNTHAIGDGHATDDAAAVYAVPVTSATSRHRLSPIRCTTS